MLEEQLPYPKRAFLETVLDYITDSKYMSSEFHPAPDDMALPSYVEIEDPKMGAFRIAFKIELPEWPGEPGIYDAIVYWRLE